MRKLKLFKEHGRCQKAEECSRACQSDIWTCECLRMPIPVLSNPSQGKSRVHLAKKILPVLKAAHCTSEVIRMFKHNDPQYHT